MYKRGYELQYYVAKSDQVELWLVRPDELKRALRFKKDWEIKIGPNSMKFLSDDVDEELTVDEDERMGKASHSRLTFD